MIGLQLNSVISSPNLLRRLRALSAANLHHSHLCRTDGMSYISINIDKIYIYIYIYKYIIKILPYPICKCSMFVDLPPSG